MHEFAHGPFATCRLTLKMSAHRGEPEVFGGRSESHAIDPSRHFGRKLAVPHNSPHPMW
jgi:hypothetical protein